MTQFTAAVRAEILPVKIDLRPFLDAAEEFTTKKVEGLDLKLKPEIAKIGTVEEGLASKASSQALADSIKDAKEYQSAETAKLIKRDLEFADDVSDAKILAEAANDNAKIAQRAAGDAIRKADDAFDLGKTAKQIAGEALDIGSKALDLVGFLLQLGTALRMEFIYNELKQRDAELANLINELFGITRNIEEVNADQQFSINDLYRIIQGLQSLSSSQFQTLLAAIEGQRQFLEPTYNNTYQLLDDVGSLSGKVDSLGSRIDSLTDIEIQTQTKVDSGFGNLPPIIKDKVCEALNDDCNPFNGFDFGNNNGNNNNNNNDLSGINSLLNQINGKLGGFPYSCSIGGSSVGSVSDALRRLTCGFGFDGNDDNNNDFNDIKNKLDELNDKLTIDVTGQAVNYEASDDNEELKTLETLTYDGLGSAFSTLFNRLENSQFSSFDAGLRANLFVPETWAIKIEGNRPQLIAGMQDAATAGTGSASKWQITVPRVRSDIQNFTFEELKEYFPDYTHGQYYARAVLKDGSSFSINASSTTAAKNYMNKLLELVDPAYIPDGLELATGTRTSINKNTKVTCRGIGYHATGRVKGKKPTKRWYLPQKKDK